MQFVCGTIHTLYILVEAECMCYHCVSAGCLKKSGVLLDYSQNYICGIQTQKHLLGDNKPKNNHTEKMMHCVTRLLKPQTHPDPSVSCFQQTHTALVPHVFTFTLT